MVNVANRADIHVRLGPLKLAFCHFILPSKRTIYLLIQKSARAMRQGRIMPVTCFSS
jgi:hypothetical protein